MKESIAEIKAEYDKIVLELEKQLAEDGYASSEPLMNFVRSLYDNEYIEFFMTE